MSSPDLDLARSVVVCADFGSTFTKTQLVDLEAAAVVATATHPTTIATDVLDGYSACLAELTAADPRAVGAPAMACSSAGGGLRIAVFGNEELVTAEAGRRVALSSGGKVVAVLAASRAQHADQLAAATPDVVLLTGGTDGGNEESVLACAEDLVSAGWSGPVVVAGNVAARDRIGQVLTRAGVPHVLTDNVVPRIGVLTPGPARSAVRELFLSHVIGGKHLSRSPDFAAMVRGATPDVVLTGVETLARGVSHDQPGGRDVAVVDIGGATTDVHSVVEVDPEDSGLSREVVATTPVTRTVEGDLGMRWSAPSTVAAAELTGLAEAAQRRHDDPSFVPHTAREAEIDEAIAAAAVGLAMRRHAGRSRIVISPEGRVVERTGKDLRQVSLLIGSGGVFRHADDDRAARIVAGSIGPQPEGWQLPERPRLVVDHTNVLCAVGLLAETFPEVAGRLARRLLDPSDAAARPIPPGLQ